MTERDRSKTFSKDITKLVFGVNLNQLDITRSDLFTEPMVLDGVVFGTRSHTLWFKATESEGANVVFVDGGVEVSFLGDRKADGIA